MDREGTISMVPYDGVRRQIRFLTPVQFSVELEQDGFRKDYPVTLKKQMSLRLSSKIVPGNLIIQG